MLIIKPTVGRRVHYWPSDYELGLLENKPTSIMTASDRSQPCDAGIVYVWSDRMVNLTVADHNGVMHARTSVQLVQEGDARWPGASCATWMDYQIGAEKKQIEKAALNELADDLLKLGEAFKVDIIDKVAETCHEVNRAYCSVFGDDSHLPWADVPQWQRDSAVSAVKFHMGNPEASASATHDAWMAEKVAAGWVYGDLKDASATPPTHPRLLPFHALPQWQQAKDQIFRAIVHQLVPEGLELRAG